jgi:hypothetical protein
VYDREHGNTGQSGGLTLMRGRSSAPPSAHGDEVAWWRNVGIEPSHEIRVNLREECGTAKQLSTRHWRIGADAAQAFLMASAITRSILALTKSLKMGSRCVDLEMAISVSLSDNGYLLPAIAARWAAH